MPVHTLAVDVPAQTNEGGRETDRTEVEVPVVTEAEIWIDPGAFDEVRARLRVGEANLIPEPSGRPIQKPGTTGPVPVNKRLPGVPGDVTLEAWAPDADFLHPVVANVEVKAPENVVQEVRLVEENLGTAAEREPGRLSPEQLTGQTDEG